MNDRGFLDWFKKTDADIVCLQEIKASPDQLSDEVINIPGYFSFFNPAEKPGYSGVAVYTKEKPEKIYYLLFGHFGLTRINNYLENAQDLGQARMTTLERFNKEGRFLCLEFIDYFLVNVYLPHRGRDQSNLKYKLEVYKKLIEYLGKLKGKNVVLIGDFNVAHTELDLARPRQNVRNIMFTPEERAQIERLIEMGFSDTFRLFNKEGGYYTWWPYFANARERNLGWRIDYCFVSKGLIPKVKNSFILPEIHGSDHCPIGLEFG
ncbi:MAG: exodeoxyribonuclease III [Patescibacteria group bacterium]|nr:exodeoxyribonuclease III [Patescibacteria group bacterium]